MHFPLVPSFLSLPSMALFPLNVSRPSALPTPYTNLSMEKLNQSSNMYTVVNHDWSSVPLQWTPDVEPQAMGMVGGTFR